ncbi:MAG: DUF1080 domain-containing protein [Bacteroidota bacterium]
MKFNTLTIILVITLASISCQNRTGKREESRVEEEHDWEMLFNGENLDGWTINNQDFDNPEILPEFYVEDQMIICNTSMHKGGGYLVTEKSYDNFMLELDVKIDTLLNSGIQCRGQIWEKDTATRYIAGDASGTVRYNSWPAGYVWGYQIEIDPSDRAWSGGLYEPGNRGWVVTMAGNEEAQKAFRRKEWNHFRVVMDGNHIQSWINGVLAVDTIDNMSQSGFVGLQFHGAYRDEQRGMKSMWKNIRIKEL